MDIFIKSAACTVVALILSRILSNQHKDIGLLLSVVVCSMTISIAITYLKPVFDFFDKLKTIGELDESMIKIVLKSVGIGLFGEITNTLCVDGGNSALGKTMQMLASCMILWISLPLFESLLELIEEVLKFL